MNVGLELRKFMKNPIHLVQLALFLIVTIFISVGEIRAFVHDQNDLIDEATVNQIPITEKGYQMALEYTDKHRLDWTSLDSEAQNRYRFDYFYISKMDWLQGYNDFIAEKKDKALREGEMSESEEHRFALIDQRINDLSFLRRYDAESFKKIIHKLWNYYLLIVPILFSGIYAYDKEHITSLLATCSESGKSYLFAKVKVTVLLGTILFWLPIIGVFIYFVSNTNFLQELSLPYYYVAPLSSWSLNTGQALSWLVFSSFIQYIYVLLIVIFISQSSPTLLVSALANLLYAGGSVFILNQLVPLFHQSFVVKLLVSLWGLSPAGALSSSLRHDYAYPRNFLDLPFLKDYNLPLVSSTFLMILISFLLYQRRRSCYRK